MSNYITLYNYTYSAAYGDNAFGADVYGEQTTTTQITEPVSGSTGLADTGFDIFIVVAIALASIAAGLYLLINKRNHKKN